MKRINMLTLMSCTAVMLGALTAIPSFAADTNMMMEKNHSMMIKSDSTTAMSHETNYNATAFSTAQASGKPFLIAFHKKGCSRCAAQKKALKEMYANPAHKDLKVLVVNYNDDTASLKKFNVGDPSTLILYKGTNEISRSSDLVHAADIEKQLNS